MWSGLDSKKAFKKLRPNPKPHNKGQKGEQRKNAYIARNIKTPEWRQLHPSVRGKGTARMDH